MSKKKNKFKKKHQTQHNISTPLTVEREISPGGEILEEILDNKPAPTDHEAEDLHDVYKTDKYAHVKKDIKKILIIMAIIILALIGIYVLSLKTTIFSTFGNWIYKILNIQVS